jgi:hypothetical protein
MSVDQASHQTVSLEEQLDELNVTHEPANKITDERPVPTDVEEAALSPPEKSQPKISDNTQVAPKTESSGSEEVHPISETPIIQRSCSVPPTSSPGKDFNAMDIDTTPVPEALLSGAGPSATMPYTTNGSQLSILPQSHPASEGSQSE